MPERLREKISSGLERIAVRSAKSASTFCFYEPEMSEALLAKLQEGLEKNKEKDAE